jgi:hypothetical protein
LYSELGANHCLWAERTGVLAKLPIRSVLNEDFAIQEIALVDYPGLNTTCLSRSRLACCRQAFEQYLRRRPPNDDGSGRISPHTKQRLIRRRRSLLGNFHYDWQSTHWYPKSVLPSEIHLDRVAHTTSKLPPPEAVALVRMHLEGAMIPPLNRLAIAVERTQHIFRGPLARTPKKLHR